MESKSSPGLLGVNDNNAYRLLRQPKKKLTNKRSGVTHLKKEDVSKVLPCCVLIHHVLSEELANILLLEMIEDSKTWRPLPVVLFGKEMISV